MWAMRLSLKVELGRFGDEDGRGKGEKDVVTEK